MGRAKNEKQAPAKVVKDADKAKAKAKAKADTSSVAMEKGEVSNMLGSLKCSKDPAKQELLAYYKGLSRFDSQKAELLKKWKADKSCKWLGEYKESRTQKASTTNEELSGFATKYLGCIILHISIFVFC